MNLPNNWNEKTAATKAGWIATVVMGMGSTFIACLWLAFTIGDPSSRYNLFSLLVGCNCLCTAPAFFAAWALFAMKDKQKAI